MTVKDSPVKLSILTALLILGLSACSQWQGDAAKIVISLGGAGRGAVGGVAYDPKDTATHQRLEHEIVLTGAAETLNFSLTGRTTFETSVTPGNWNVLVNSFLDGAIYATGSKDVIIKLGQNNETILMYQAHLVTFDSNGGSAVPDQIVRNGGFAKEPSRPARDDYTFEGWYDETLAAAWDFESDAVTGTITLYAKWAEKSAAPGTAATPTAAPPPGTYTEAHSVTLATSTAGARIYYTTDGSDPTTDSALYSSPIAINATTTIKAIAVKDGMANSGILRAVYTIVDLLARAERVTLANANQVVYRFVLPAGKTWSNYQKITADYLVPDKDTFTKTDSARAIRLYGNYDLDFFQFHTTDAGNKYAYATLNGPENNDAYILAQECSPWMILNEALTELLGTCPAANEWFTINYTIDGSKSFVQPPQHLPAAGDAGPFIFGLGLPGQDINTFYIRDVKLVGKPGTADVIATPLYITSDGYDYPAFCAYATASGNGVDDLSRKMADGSQPEAIPAAPAGDVNKPLDVTFTGPTEKVITITRSVTPVFSKSAGGSITLGITERFDQYVWFIGGTKAASGNSVTLYADNAAFTPGINWITVVVYTGATPWSGDIAVTVSE